MWSRRAGWAHDSDSFCDPMDQLGMGQSWYFQESVSRGDTQHGSSFPKSVKSLFWAWNKNLYIVPVKTQTQNPRN